MDNTIRTSVCEVLRCSPCVADTACWAKLYDSLALVRIALELEERFRLRFTPEELGSKEFRTVSGLIAIIKRKRDVIKEDEPVSLHVHDGNGTTLYETPLDIPAHTSEHYTAPTGGGGEFGGDGASGSWDNSSDSSSGDVSSGDSNSSSSSD